MADTKKACNITQHAKSLLYQILIILGINNPAILLLCKEIDLFL